MESNLKARILRYIRQQPDMFAVKYHGSAFALRGMTDIFGNVGPFAFYLELKDQGEKPTPLQEAVQRKIRKTGVCVATVDSYDDAVNFLRKIRDRALDKVPATC